MKVNNVYVGNNIEVLKTFPDNSIDSVVTDPPYGLGKEPNAIEVLQSWITTGYHEVKGKGFMGKEWDAFVPQPIFWKECLRVLKPGGHLLSFAGTRTYDWIVMGLRFAGFEIRDQIAWLYGSGFPKSKNIGLSIDKELGHGNRGHRISTASRFHPDGTREPNGDKLPPYEGKEEQSKSWQGWGTALKPALEPIVMARKPLDGTVAQNVLKHGVGGINIDECRIGDEPFEITDGDYDNGNNVAFGNIKRTPKTYNGRFPANVIHDGSDEVESLFPYTESGGSGKIGTYRKAESNIEFTSPRFVDENNFRNGDEGSASRFFYTAKASQEERNFGLSGFEDDVTTDGRKKSIDNAFNRGETKRKNIHPTVKPIDLMRYLVRLVTPPNGICLDPYLGSGTTAIACKIEKFSWIGIELMPEYAEIAKARIGAVKDYEATLDTKTFIKESIKEDKEKELGIQNIFDFMED